MARKRVTGKSVKGRQKQIKFTAHPGKLERNWLKAQEQKLEKSCAECGAIGDQQVKLYSHPGKKGKKICLHCLRKQFSLKLTPFN